MITIVDKSTHYQLTLLDIPSFPDSLRAKLEAAEEAGPDEAREFLSWWVPACQKRGFIHGRIANAEEIVHARRLLTKYTLPQLRELAVEYFASFAREEWRGPQLLRMLWTLSGEVEEQVKRNG